MHLRLTSSFTQNGSDFVDNPNDMMDMLKPHTTSCIQQNNHQQTKGTWTKKLILWCILLIQFGFILCFWLMQLGLSGKLNDSSGVSNSLDDNRINFVQAEALKDVKVKGAKNAKSLHNFQWPSRDLKFQNEFLLHQNTFNLSEAEKIMFGETSLWCFNEGTNNESRLRGDTDDSNPFQEHCECLPDWHGRDCGQPEVIWRALLTAKIPFKVKDPSREEAHRLVYMIEGPFLNLDLIELQIKAVIKVVDYFLIYFKRNILNRKDLKTLKYRLKLILPTKNYFLYHCKLPTYNNNNCSATEAYRLFRQQQLPSNAIKPSDIFIYTNDKTILGHRALNFLKYYSSEISTVIQFRLKFSVYGFYWQHPKQTYLTGLISSFQTLDNCESNPSMLLAQISSQTTNQQQLLVIGDLNHFGGWFCKYCQEPDEIINELLQPQQSSSIATTASSAMTIQNHIVFPTDERQSPHIDVAYIQKLISTGIYLKDGTTHLQRVRRFSDKYYAPIYAAEQSWKYGHLLVNIYESLEDENEEELF